MPSVHLTTIVFVGSRFHAGMFDERELCPSLGEIEMMETERKQESGRYSYSRGRYQFTISPERLTLSGPEIFPEEIVEATRMVIARLDKFNPLSAVTAVGLNCDSMFEQEELGCSGAHFCEKINNRSDVENLLGETVPLSESMTSTNFYFVKGSVRYGLRIEPHFGTQGKNLFFAMNAHQDMAGKRAIIESLDVLDGIRKYTKELHDCLIRKEGMS